MADRPPVDFAIIGAGAGGLGAAITLAASGASVALLEALKYPGGCAATFERQGYRFDAGATLSAGFSEGQLFSRWQEEHGLDLTVHRLDPVMEFRTSGVQLEIPDCRQTFIERLCALDDVPEAPTRAFFAFQKQVADRLWHVIDNPHLMPPYTPRTLLSAATMGPSLIGFLPLMGKPLSAVLQRFGLLDCVPVRALCDALCQITVQCQSDEAEAPFALSAIDYLFRGTAHVMGGIGQISHEMVRSIERYGGDVSMGNRVKRLERHGQQWRIECRKGTIHAKCVIANMIPEAVCQLLGERPASLRTPLSQVESGWGACMLYLGVKDGPELPSSAKHIEVVQDPHQPLPSGNHLLVSISDPRDTTRAPPGQRVVTVSTHVPMSDWKSDPQQTVNTIHQTMRHGLNELVPEVADRIVVEMPASPRTFERFTRRPQGFVGGPPRRVGLRQYGQVFPRPIERGLWLAGDSVMLGQSVLAAATSGERIAKAALKAS